MKKTGCIVFIFLIVIVLVLEEIIGYKLWKIIVQPEKSDLKHIVLKSIIIVIICFVIVLVGYIIYDKTRKTKKSPTDQFDKKYRKNF